MEKEKTMNNFMRTKSAVVYYSEEDLKDTVCCLCGEKADLEFRGLGVCSRCVKYIQTRD
jgi:hypothetical protein